ncbi:two-component system, OmpR family, sensor kinase [Micromonospora chaiyaphumensis]|uniref:histidine kinase n=2 Tax=Micromonospora chaiyaphumensis TaxID=307119 RepID=A0A1C4VLQ9_9ACTN|nr:ATP-binding protein [Micromonospora chaiyaphumensis]SCE84964.1 two-component system, OmpR family, sensor kinase [Micromonospora chaiyaphumensis]
MVRRLPLPRRWGHWTLRSRLVVVIATLAAVALIVANTAGLVLLRSYLTDRVDEQLARMARIYQNGIPPDLGQGFARPGRPPGGGPGQAVLIYRADGTALPGLLSAEDLSPPELPGHAELLARAVDRRPFTVDAEDGGSDWRVIVVPTGDGGLAVAGQSLRDVEATADGLLLIDGAVMLLVVLVLVLVAASVVRIGLRPLTRMESISAEITAGDLSRRVEDTDPHTEPGRLGIALNVMLDRIGAEMAARSASEQRLRQFVADASHELRTPLTSIRGFAELYRRGGAPPGPLLDESMSRIEAEAARMGVLVEDLLLLARLDLHRPQRRAPVDLLAIAADTVRDAHARVPDRPVRLATMRAGESGHADGGPEDGGFEPVTVHGDEHRLRQVATNLVANALQHTPPEAEITVRVGRLDAAGLAVLEVADTGPGIPAEHAGRVFERLYRVDASRTRGRGVGSGLGLAIVAAIVESHGGRVGLVTGVGRGATFRVLLPVGAAGPAPARDRAGGHGSQPAPS